MARLTAVALVMAMLAACGDDPEPRAPALDGGLYATFMVYEEEYHASIKSAEGMQQARDLWAGNSSATIPNGRLVCRDAPWNSPWSFYQDPHDLHFAEVTIEVCDGTPSYVSDNCRGFGGGRFCPWGAQMTELRDCTTDPACPPVPR